MDSIKDVVRSSVKVPEFDKKAGGHISRNVVEIAIKMKTIVRKPLMIKIKVYVRVKNSLSSLLIFFHQCSKNNSPSIVGCYLWKRRLR